MTRGDLDTRPVTKHEYQAGETRKALKLGAPVGKERLAKYSAADLRDPAPAPRGDTKRWTEADRFYGGASGEAIPSDAFLTTGKLSGYGGDDIIVTNAANNELIIMPLVYEFDYEQKVAERIVFCRKTSGN